MKSNSIKLGLFGLFLAVFGEVFHYVCFGWFASIQPIAQDIYYVCIASALLVGSVSLYSLSESRKLKLCFEMLIYFFSAKLLDELSHRATTFDNKEFWYLVAIIVFVLLKSMKLFNKNKREPLG